MAALDTQQRYTVYCSPPILRLNVGENFIVLSLGRQRYIQLIHQGER